MILSVAMLIYRILWLPLLPLVLVYLWRRGRKDRLYVAHLAERFGFYSRPLPRGAIWIHAVSLGEMRSATALIHLLIARGDKVLLTHFTPAGRRESARLFAAEIAAGQIAAIWVPLDMGWCYRRFLRAARPRIGLTLEVEIWPAMIFAARRAGLPLYLCNAQYPLRSFTRDSKGLQLRRRLIGRYSGAMVKSRLQADRFASAGLDNITITGELRFDLPIPADQIEAARQVRPLLGLGRTIVAIASGVEGEEALFADTIRRLRDQMHEAAPLVVYVPRAPERFAAVASGLRASGLRVGCRSNLLGAKLAPSSLPVAPLDVMVGDSLGEMFFYLALSDLVVVGGGFTWEGAHNIIESLMLAKPVLTGPHTWPVEYPFAEAEAAGIARSLPDQAALITALAEPVADIETRALAFLDAHAGASSRTVQAIDCALGVSS